GGLQKPVARRWPRPHARAPSARCDPRARCGKLGLHRATRFWNPRCTRSFRGSRHQWCRANIVDSMQPTGPLGEFELTVLLAVLQLGDDASGARVLEVIGERTGREIGRGAVYVTLDRLADKRLLTARTD